jgi:hypothetical protein
VPLDIEIQALIACGFQCGSRSKNTLQSDKNIYRLATAGFSHRVDIHPLNHFEERAQFVV